MYKEQVDITKKEAKFSGIIEKFKTSYITRRIAEVSGSKGSDVGKSFEDLETELLAFVDNVVTPMAAEKKKAEFRKWYFQETPTYLGQVDELEEHSNDELFRIENLKNMMMEDVK